MNYREFDLHLPVSVFPANVYLAAAQSLRKRGVKIEGLEITLEGESVFLGCFERKEPVLIVECELSLMKDGKRAKDMKVYGKAVDEIFVSRLSEIVDEYLRRNPNAED